MKKTTALALATACAALLSFARPATAGLLTLVTGPTYTPPEAFSNTTITADTTIEGGLIHLTGNTTITPGSSATAEIDLSGTFSADVGDEFSIAYSFSADLNIPGTVAYTIVGTITGAGGPIPVQASGTIAQGLNKYEGSFASPGTPVPLTGTFSGTITFDFSGTTGPTFEAAPGSLDISIQQIDFRVAPLPVTVDAPSLNQNLSTRGNVGPGEDVLIGGFIITGTDNKQVVLRGLGPSLDPAQVGKPLADPVLELHDADGNIITTNDNWMDNSQTDQTFLTDNGLAPSNPKESAIVASLAPAHYTAIVHSADTTTGVALVEIYDLDNGTTDSKLANISTRGNVGTGEDVVIGGFIVGGGGGGFTSTIIRGLGPSLGDMSVSVPLADPTIKLVDVDGNVIDQNDNWMDNPNMQTISEDDLAPADPSESALYEILPPGKYTAILSGVNGGTGVGLVEIYDVDETAR